MSQRDPSLMAAPEPGGPVPAEVEVRVDDHLHPAETDPTTTRKSSREVLRACFETLDKHLFVPGIEADRECLRAIKIIGNFIRMRYRCGEELLPIDRPLSYVKLRAAIAALLKYSHLLQKETRSALRGVSLEDLATSDQHIEVLRELVETLDGTANRARTKLAHTEVFADFTLRGVFNRARSAIETQFDLGQALSPLTDLVIGGAIAGKETKKLTAKVAADTTEQVVQTIKDAFNANKTTPQTPKTPDEILDAVTNKPPRDRGKPR